MKTLALIEKEHVSNLSFCKEEVLTTKEEIQLRSADLHRAQTLGNLLQTKVRINFETRDGKIHQVHTTVWAVGAEFILLKGAKAIPIHCIHSVV